MALWSSTWCAVQISGSGGKGDGVSWFYHDILIGTLTNALYFEIRSGLFVEGSEPFTTRMMQASIGLPIRWVQVPRHVMSVHFTVNQSTGCVPSFHSLL
jgi:hypothetical protein